MNYFLPGMRYFFILVSIYHSACCIEYYSKSNYAPLVETIQGSVIGKYVKVSNTIVTAFLGIPFAKPPIGEKRYAKPEPITKWGKTIIANKKSPACEQYSSRGVPAIPKTLKISEDCLYLNIWTPVHCFCNTTEKLPVLVWIYGGAFFLGSASAPMYDGGVIASYGNVIVASMNYRLGSFGFLNSGTDEAPGNVGIYDQLLAMKWIKANIHSFGGDPSSITLFGQSAGATSVSSHMISPLSKGLFQKGIQESGSNVLPYYNQDYKVSLSRANYFAKLVNCRNESQIFPNNSKEILRCLKAKSPYELTHAEDTITSKVLEYFKPWYGSKFLPENPRTALKSGNFPNIPNLIGTNKDEGTIVLVYFFPDLFPINKTPKLTFLQARDVVKRSLKIFDVEVSPEAVIDFYFKNVNKENSSDILRAVTHFAGDITMDCPSLIFAENWGNSRLYWLTHISRKDPAAQWIGVRHSYELQFVFGKPIINKKKYTEEDKRFSRDIIHKWTNFARTG
nr:cholinesterase-like [Parasteatoda tepidariorum]